MSELSATTPAFEPAARTQGLGPEPEPAPAPADDPRIGSVLKGSYRLERLLGAGGMGAVYQAEHTAIRKKVAVKILGQEYAHRPELKERFLREARAAAAISDDHVIEIHDFGDTPDGSAFFVMEYLQGHDLADVIARDAPLPWPRARDICVQICRALQAAHERGIVHRDMKPGNVFRLDRPGRDTIKVLDFGIAKFQNPDEGVGQALTRTGMIFGTPEYMSPEQAQGQRHDHRVDIYAVGVILFEMLTGRTPFIADTFMGLLNKHMFEAPPRPGDVAPDANIPEAAEAVVLKALQKDPALRFPTMTAMIDALQAVDAGVAPEVVPEALQSPPAPGAATPFRKRELAPTVPPVAPSRRWPAIAALLAVVAAGLAVVVLSIVQGPSDMVDPPAPAAPRAPEPPPLAPPVAVVEPARQEPAPEPTVAIRIDTGGVAAQVLDQDGAILGSTTDALELPRATVERTLRLRADGYDEVTLKTTPSEDRTLTVTLPRKPEAAKKTGKTGKTGKPETRPETKTETKPDTKTKPPNSPDLISPFGN